MWIFLPPLTVFVFLSLKTKQKKLLQNDCILLFIYCIFTLPSKGLLNRPFILMYELCGFCFQVTMPKTSLLPGHYLFFCFHVYWSVNILFFQNWDPKCDNLSLKVWVWPSSNNIVSWVHQGYVINRLKMCFLTHLLLGKASDLQLIVCVPYRPSFDILRCFSRI